MKPKRAGSTLMPSSTAGVALGTTKDICLSMMDGPSKTNLDLPPRPLKTSFLPPGHAPVPTVSWCGPCSTSGPPLLTPNALVTPLSPGGWDPCPHPFTVINALCQETPPGTLLPIPHLLPAGLRIQISSGGEQAGKPFFHLFNKQLRDHQPPQPAQRDL